MNPERRGAFLRAFIDLEEETVLPEVQAFLNDGLSATALLKLCLEGLLGIGHLYETQGYFVAGLIIADDMMRGVMEMISAQPEFKPSDAGLGRVVVGTVEGDIHDLGKNVASMFLRAHGYEVIDLGVDVPPAVFLGKAMELQPDMIGLSMLTISCFEALKRTVHLLKNEIPPEYRRPFVAVGGGVVDERVLNSVRADALTGDFENTVILAGNVCGLGRRAGTDDQRF
ncbi:MAG: cobalamin-dependent protein [Candidatus Adiutrix sp.]|nr:cobalamin-dependent protein [Candidatus Adiutrix sp.]